MKLAEVMIAWTPMGVMMRTAGLVTVDAHPDTTGWSARYMHAVGACDAECDAGGDAERLAILFKPFTPWSGGTAFSPKMRTQRFCRSTSTGAESAPDIKGAEPLK